MMLLLFAVGFLWGAGQEETEVTPGNPEWVLCVTAFDISALPEDRRIIGQVLSSRLVGALQEMEYRIRVSSEYAFYEANAWAATRTAMGRRIAAKREERDMLLYRGNPDWQYRRELARIDKELETLEEEYGRADSEAPLIENRPVFLISDENKRDVFPTPGERGLEYQFCQSHRADGFLTGRIMEYHGRLFISLRLYSLYARSYNYEDFAIFSPESIQDAVDELTGRLVSALQGAPSAAIAVTAWPEDALITINDSLVGMGHSAVLERVPGPVTITIAAENHVPQTLELELASDELVDLSLSLTPLILNPFRISTPGQTGTHIYQGSLYIGETPVDIAIPRNQFEYIEALSDSGEQGSRVVAGGPVPSYTPLTIPIRLRPPKAKKEVDISRGQFYGAYGRFWVIMPLAYVFYGIASSVLTAYNTSANPDLYDRANLYYYVSLGSVVAAAGLLGESLLRASWYIYTATKRETAIH